MPWIIIAGLLACAGSADGDTEPVTGPSVAEQACLRYLEVREACPYAGCAVVVYDCRRETLDAADCSTRAGAAAAFEELDDCGWIGEG